MKAFVFCVLAMATCMPARGGVDYSGGTYRENFDSLGTNGVSWTNGAAVPGCYAYEGLLSSWRWVSDYGVCGGAFSAVEQGDSLLNCGNKGSTNRALGAVAYQLDVTFALVLRNTTTNTFDSFSLSYSGEQWRLDGCSQDYRLRLNFNYGVFPTFSDSPQNPNTVCPSPQAGPDALFFDGYVDPPGNALDFAPLKYCGPIGPLDGDTPSNRTNLSWTAENLCWLPGHFLVLRWYYPWLAPSGVKSIMLAVDDLEFTATAQERFRFSNVKRLTNGNVELSICGFISEVYMLQTSTDLDNWQDLITLTNTVGVLGYTDTTATVLQRRFYRAVRQ